MIIASRMLKLHSSGTDREVEIAVHAPERAETDWRCRYEIGWPDAHAERWAAGIDAVQALSIALNMIGAELYASAEHARREIEWLAGGEGYGFPLAKTIRDLAIGHDKDLL